MTLEERAIYIVKSYAKDPFCRAVKKVIRRTGMEKSKRRIIEIDETLCDGCGLCIPSCAEGAIKLVDGKARLVSESLCDGLGACLGVCPKGALRIVEREARPFDGGNVSSHIGAHFEASCECGDEIRTPVNWPIQLRLISPKSPQLKDADIVISADCVPFVLPSFHAQILNGRKVIISCPKLDPADLLRHRLAEIIKEAHPKNLTLSIMEIPCCRGFFFLIREGLISSGLKIPVRVITISTRGEILKEETL
jgi:ferredoxin